MQDTVAARSVETKTDTKTHVFISYSRKDIAFADRLEAALKARDLEVLIDRQETYAFEDWWKRIEALIGSADTVVFVLSPDAVKSDVALKEVTFAASLNKRFAPIVCRGVENGAVPEALRRLNFIFFDDLERFDESVDSLAEALRTDIGWEQTRRSLFAHVDDPRRSRSPWESRGQTGPAKPLACEPSAAPAPERHGRGAREQECSHRLGYDRREFLLRTDAIRSGGLIRGGSSEDVRKTYLAIATTHRRW